MLPRATVKRKGIKQKSTRITEKTTRTRNSTRTLGNRKECTVKENYQNYYKGNGKELRRKEQELQRKRKGTKKKITRTTEKEKELRRKGVELQRKRKGTKKKLQEQWRGGKELKRKLLELERNWKGTQRKNTRTIEKTEKNYSIGKLLEEQRK